MKTFNEHKETKPTSNDHLKKDGKTVTMRQRVTKQHNMRLFSCFLFRSCLCSLQFKRNSFSIMELKQRSSSSRFDLFFILCFQTCFTSNGVKKKKRSEEEKQPDESSWLRFSVNFPKSPSFLLKTLWRFLGSSLCGRRSRSQQVSVKQTLKNYLQVVSLSGVHRGPWRLSFKDVVGCGFKRDILARIKPAV